MRLPGTLCSQGGGVYHTPFSATKVATKKDAEYFSNDPTAGSPTVTLLRLLLPLNDQV